MHLSVQVYAYTMRLEGAAIFPLGLPAGPQLHRSLPNSLTAWGTLPWWSDGGGRVMAVEG